jgi:transposase-like protein
LLEEKSSSETGLKKWPWRYPPAAAGIQVNFCKSPKCGNFGVPPSNEPKRGRPAAGSEPKVPAPGDYTVVAIAKDVPALKCSLCKEVFPMHSNLAVAEELMRISAYLDPAWPACPNDLCGLFGKADEAAGKQHTRYGVNRHGTPRYQCGSCHKVFAFGGGPDKRQRDTHHNRDIFTHLVNTVPIRRIVKLLGISTSVLYTRIDFIHKQCQLFAGERERTLLDKTGLGSRYISVDRQKLLVNWSSKKTRKNTLLLSIASADQDSGYVYAANLNFDPDLEEDYVLEDMQRFGDHKLRWPFRRYARVWLGQDFEKAAIRAGERRADAEEKPEKSTPQSSKPIDKLLALVGSRYEQIQAQDVIDDGVEPSVNTRTPVKGMLLHESAVMQAHMQLVCRLLGRAEKLRFFLDQESGLRAALMMAVPQRVLERTADAFFVTVLKEATVDQKRGLVAKSKKDFQAFYEDLLEEASLRDELPTVKEAQVAMVRREMTRFESKGPWRDSWVRHPIADMREPVKVISWLTDIDPEANDKKEQEEQLNHAARLYLKASATEVDRFFMQVRRALTMAERGVVSASADYRRWFGKNAYNPGVLVKLIEIFRTYFNYCEVGGDKMTPAMRMGLAKGPVAPEDILYFQPRPVPGRRKRQPAVVRED